MVKHLHWDTKWQFTLRELYGKRENMQNVLTYRLAVPALLASRLYMVFAAM
jgi:hypothetical protein